MNPGDLVLFVEYSLGYRILDQLVSLATGCLTEFKWRARLDQDGDLKSFSVMDDHPALRVNSALGIAPFLAPGEGLCNHHSYLKNPPH